MTVRIEQVERFLSERYAPERIASIGAGEWSAAFSFEHRGQRLVARFGRHPEDFRKDEAAARRFGARLPVASVLEIGDAFDGLAFAVSQWMPGEPIDRLPGPDLRAALPALLDAMDVVRTLPPPAATGFGSWSSRGTAEHASWRDALLAIVEDEEHPRIAGWRAFLRSDPEWSRAFDMAAARLAELADACPIGARHVLHADLTAGNVLVRDASVSAVLDWGNSLLGDPLFDVAWLVFWSPWHPGLDPDFVLAETRRRFAETGADAGNFDERVRACQLTIGLESMAYNAFRRDAENMRGTMRRLREVVVAGADP